MLSLWLTTFLFLLKSKSGTNPVWQNVSALFVVSLHKTLSPVGNMEVIQTRDFLHFDRQAQLICIWVRDTLGIWGDVVRVCLRAVYSCLCVIVWVFWQRVLMQGSINLTELETSDGAEEHVVHISSIHTHTHTDFQSVLNCKQLSQDESSHRIFSSTLILQVLKYLDYVFTGVFTFEMVIKVRRLSKWWYTLIWALKKIKCR